MTRILAAFLATLLAGAAAAQYPNKPIRLIVPFPPGGAAELGARIFAQPLGQALGQPVIIETKPGADGAIAADATMAESGLAGLSITPWGGIFGPKGMPREIAERLSRELIALLKRPEVREAFGLLAFEPRGSTPEELAAFTKEQLEVWRRVVGEVGIKPE